MFGAAEQPMRSNSHPTKVFSLQAELLHTLDMSVSCSSEDKNCSPEFLLPASYGCGHGAAVRGQWPAVATRAEFAEFVQKNQSASQSSNNGDSGIGWGSSIEVGRLARAAEDALKHGNPSAAADYAQRAVKAAPQDNKLWFLLGYTLAAGRAVPDLG